MQMKQAVDAGKQLVKQINDDEVPDLAAGLAYRFLFALFPFAIFLAALAGFVSPLVGLGDPTSEIMGSLADNLPPDVAEQIRPQLEAVLGDTRPGLLTIGAITALWAAQGGIASIIKGMNKAYDVEETRNFFVKTGTAIGLTIVGSVLILLAFVTIVGGSVLTEQAVEQLGIAESLWTTISLIRFPLVLALVALAVAGLFKLGPNVRVSFKWTLVGGFVFAVTWVLATLLFGLYVANFSNYANTYGALGGVVILMLWFYLTGLMMLIAAEVTSLLAKAKEPEKIAARRDELSQKSAARKVGEAAGTVVGTVEAKLGVGDDDEKSDRGEPESKPAKPTEPAPRIRPELIPPTLASRPTPIPPPRPAPKVTAPVAALVVAGGAVLGAILGRLSGDDDEGAAAA
jgi:membrane protein